MLPRPASANIATNTQNEWTRPAMAKATGADQEARDQHGARAPAVDQEADRRLQHGGDDIERGEREPELGIAHAVVLAMKMNSGASSSM